MKSVIINKQARIKNGLLQNTTGVVVGFESEIDLVTIQIDDLNYIQTSSDNIDQEQLEPVLHTYFVCYDYYNQFSNGSGMCEITRKQPIENFDNIEEIAEMIKETNKFEIAVVTNWVPIKPRN